jgi:hypothetical protein
MKYFLAVLMLFCSTVASAYPLYDEKFTQRSDLKERIDHKARLALLSPLDSDIRTYIVFHFDKSKPARAASFSISSDFRTHHGAKLREQRV